MELTNRLLLKTVPPLYVFMVAAAMNDVTLAKEAFQYRYPVLAKAVNEASFVETTHLSLTPGEGDRNGVWPMELWNRVQTPFAWSAAAAWAKAWRTAWEASGDYYTSATTTLHEDFEKFMASTRVDAA